MKDREEWKLCFIFNPSANRSHNKVILERIRGFAKSWGNGSELLVSGKKGDITLIAREAAKHSDMVIACGGDGTIRETAAGLKDTSAVMGIVPIGSGNDLVKTLGIPSDPDRALELLKTGSVRSMDIGKFDSQIFVNTLGIGFDGLTNIYAERFKLFSGSFVYSLAALKAIITYRSPRFVLDIDGERIDQRLLMVTVANGKVEGGNFWLAPEAEIDDGYFDVVVVKAVNRLLLPYYLVRVLLKTHLTLKAVRIIRAKKLSVTIHKPVPVHSDGEIMGEKVSHLEIEMIPGKLKVVCPE